MTSAMVSRVLAATVRMERDRLATPLLPTSLFSGFDEDKRRLASVTLRRTVLRPIRDALLPSATLADLPPVPDPHRVEDLPSFRRLTAQFDRIADRRAALERYDRFRRSSGFDELLLLSESVFGAVAKPPVPATDGFITRIAAGADLPNLDARTIAAAVRAESVQLAAPLADELYTRNPLIVRSRALADRLGSLPEIPSTDEAEEVRRLVDALGEAAGWPIAAALQAPVRGLPEAIKLALEKAAIAELPGRDTTSRIAEALSTAATAARAEALALETPKVGRFLLADGDAAPTPSPAVAALPGALAAIARPAEPLMPPAKAPEPAKQEATKQEATRQEATRQETAKQDLPKRDSTEGEPAKPTANAPIPVPASNPAPVPAPAAPMVEARPVAVLPAPAPLPPTVLPDTGAVAKLAASFSQTLAGRFPFVRPDSTRGAPDADPQDVRRFYQLLDESRPALARGASPEQAAFLERMEAARPLLEAVARSTSLSVDLAYGTDRSREVGAEHIIDWSVRSGASAVGAANSAGPLAWKAGDPLLLSFRWAAGSPFRPKSSAANAAEAALGDTVTVAERGPWALLRLLKGRAAPAGTGSGSGTLLRIALPTQTIGGEAARDTVLFMTASVRAASAGGARQSAPLRMPDLPVKFPQ
jgi:type VI secretion system protein ImpL